MICEKGGGRAVGYRPLFDAAQQSWPPQKYVYCCFLDPLVKRSPVVPAILSLYPGMGNLLSRGVSKGVTVKAKADRYDG